MTRPLTLEIQDLGPQAHDVTLSSVCGYCGQPGAMFDVVGEAPACCVLCYLARHLERPRIDEEAILVWLPEMDQRILTLICREMHIELRAAQEALHDDAAPRGDAPELARLHHARQALRQRAEPAAARLGTDRPSELGEALRSLPRTVRSRQAALLGGLRLLPRGRFFADDEDVYLSVVDAWRSAVSNSGVT
jgi:intracellular multiplication protein IcmJ